MAELTTLGAVIKATYESEPDTNAFTDAEKSKLDAIDPENIGNVPIYDSAATVEGLEIPEGITAFRTTGETTPGDGMGALYIESDSTSGTLQSSDGRWWATAVMRDFRTFSVVADVENSHIPPAITSIRTNGYVSPGDGGGALYRRQGGNPPGNSKVKSADGSWWRPVVPDGYTFDSVADMQASLLVIPGARVRTLGYYSPGDGGGNDYEIVVAGTGTDDGGSFINLSGSGLQAKGLFRGNVASVKQYGAVGDGVSDDTLAIKNCISAHTSVEVPPGTYKMTDTLRISKDYQKITGNGGLHAKNRTEVPPSSDSGAVVFRFDDLPAGAPGVHIRHSDNGTRIDGLDIQNICIHKEVTDGKESGSIGFLVEGMQTSTVNNVSVYGFATGTVFTKNGSIRTHQSYITNLAVITCSKEHIRIKGVSGLFFSNCRFVHNSNTIDRICTIVADDKEGDGLRNLSGAIHFKDTIFIHPSISECAVYLEDNGWTVFDSCVFEGAGDCPVGLRGVISGPDAPGLNPRELQTFLSDCWFNGFTKHAMHTTDYSVVSINTRFHTSGEQAEETVLIEGGPVQNFLLTKIIGGLVDTSNFSVSPSIRIQDARGVTVSGVTISHGAESIRLSNSRDCNIYANICLNSPIHIVDDTQRSYIRHKGWVSNGDGLIKKDIYFSGTLMSNGNYSYETNLTNSIDRVLGGYGVYFNSANSPNPRWEGAKQGFVFSHANDSHVVFTGGIPNEPVKGVITITSDNGTIWANE